MAVAASGSDGLGADTSPAGGSVLASIEQRHAAERAAGSGVIASPPAGLDPAEVLLRSAYVLRQTVALVR